jgi:hypothetical protein
MVCDECGVEIQIGDFPFCPHGRSQLSVVPDDVPGGFIVENGFDQPTRFDSHSAHEQALAQRGLEIRAKNAGPDDRICPRWDAVDLDGARALVSRGVEARRSKRDPPLPISVRELPGSGVKAKDLA